MKYSWAVNPQKLERALAKAKSLADEGENKVKELYVAFGGKLIETHDQSINTEDSEPAEEAGPVAPRPKRASKRSAK